MNNPTIEFLKFLETINDYRGYEEFEGYIKEALQENRERFHREYDEVNFEDVKFETIRQFYCPPFKKHFLWGKELDEIRDYILIRIIRRYETFYELKQLFLEIIGEVETLRENGNFPPKEDSFFNAGHVPSQMYINTDGHFIEYLPTQIFYNIDFSRVKVCICGNYFWAFRKDKVSCSPECGNRIRQRKFLNDENRRKEYNEKRLKYYHENKEDIKRRKKKKGAKNNGNL